MIVLHEPSNKSIICGVVACRGILAHIALMAQMAAAPEVSSSSPLLSGYKIIKLLSVSIIIFQTKIK